ncbi:hypothetical protein DVH05_022831 [Phytophthora capsici]|nr:hypothetical protein DVH05_004536 [Phytophthora capsici]KAG1693909.1 hypothetical protein DVH05_022831 [Phytophthora capsici]
MRCRCSVALGVNLEADVVLEAILLLELVVEVNFSLEVNLVALVLEVGVMLGVLWYWRLIDVVVELELGFDLVLEVDAVL